MNTERKVLLGFECALVLIFVYAIVAAQGWRFYAALMPLVFASFGLTVSLLVLIRDARRSAVQQAAASQRTISGHATAYDTDGDLLANLPKALIFTTWAVGFFAGILIIGFPLAVPLAGMTMARIVGKVGWPVTLLVGAVLAFLVFGVYDSLLHVGWPRPLLQ